MQPLVSSLALALILGPAAAWAQEKSLSTNHDGRWTATIVCEDFKSEKGPLAKGYTLHVPLTISAGRVEGTRERDYATSGELRYTGEVYSDGELVVRAVGATGKSEYTPNRVAPGTNFGYTLKGRLGTESGSATRVELRPCSATFFRSKGAV